MAPRAVGAGKGARGGDGRRGCLRLVGCDFAGLGEVAEAMDEVFEAALQRCGGLGGKVGGFGDEGAEQPQEQLGEQAGGDAGCGGRHEQIQNIYG